MIIEIIAFILALIALWLTIKKNIWLYPIGIIDGFLYIALFQSKSLYFDTCREILFIAIQLYGWYVWGRCDDASAKIASKRELLFWTVLFFGLSPFIGHWMSCTDTPYPYIDSYVCVLSFIAQYFLVKKYIQSWLIWIIIDLILIPVCILKGIYLTSLLYFLFLILSLYGSMEWAKNDRRKN